MGREFPSVKLGSMTQRTIIIAYMPILLRVQLKIRVIIDLQMLVGVERNKGRCPHRSVGFIGKVSLSQTCQDRVFSDREQITIGPKAKGQINKGPFV